MPDVLARLRLAGRDWPPLTSALLSDAVGIEALFTDPAGAAVEVGGVVAIAYRPALTGEEAGTTPAITLTRVGVGVWAGSLTLDRLGAWSIQVQSATPTPTVARADLLVSLGGPVSFEDVRAAASAGQSANVALDAADRAEASAEGANADGVATAADRVQTGLDRTATAADRVATAADRVQTGQDRTAVAADRATATTKAAEALASASSAAGSAATATAQAGVAVAAVATGRVRKATLAELNAALAYPADAVGEVDADGANNGQYVKVGGVGVGSWTRTSIATVNSLDARDLNSAVYRLNLDGIGSAVVDPLGFASLIEDGAGGVDSALEPSRTFLRTIPGIREAVVDPLGFAFETTPDDGSATIFAAATPAEIVSSLQIEVAAYSVARSRKTAPVIQRPAWTHNLILSLGQSFMEGGGSVRDLMTDTERAGNPYPGRCKMVGNSVRGGVAVSGHVWSAIGGSNVFQPLRRTISALSTGGSGMALLDKAAQAAATEGATSWGVTPLEEAVNHIANAWEIRRGVNAAENFVAMAAAISNSSIAELSPGHASNKWNKVLTAADAFIAAATTAGGTYGVSAYVMDIGQNDYTGGTAKAAFLTALGAYFDSLHSLITIGKFGQTKRVPIFLVQAGGEYTRDTYPVWIGQALSEIAAERDEVFLVGTTYDKTNVGDGHPDTNGHCWVGAQIGDAMEQVLLDNRDFRLPQPYRICRRGLNWWISYDVMDPPLQVRAAYKVTGSTPTPIIPADLGLAAFDSSGSLPLLSPAVVAPQVIGGMFGRSPVGAVRFDAGRLDSAGGMTGIADSCSRPLLAAYRYDASVNQPAGQNVAALVDKPYPSNRFSVAWTAAAEEI